MSKNYTVQDIFDYLAARGHEISKQQISGVLYRFNQQGKIHERERGSGKKPTIYRIPI